MSSPGSSPTGRRAEYGIRLAGLAGAIAVALIAPAGCGSGAADSPAAPETRTAPAPVSGVVDISGTDPVGDGATPVGEMTAGSVAQLVECRDWNAADEGERLATIEDVRSQINLEDSGIDAPALTDEEAAKLFDGACRKSWAAGFRLYKLYARAAGFVTLNRVLDG